MEFEISVFVFQMVLYLRRRNQRSIDRRGPKQHGLHAFLRKVIHHEQRLLKLRIVIPLHLFIFPKSWVLWRSVQFYYTRIYVLVDLQKYSSAGIIVMHRLVLVSSFATPQDVKEPSKPAFDKIVSSTHFNISR